MNLEMTPHRKANLLAIFALSVGLGMLATSVAQAASPNSTRASRNMEGSEKWWQSIWGLDLARKLKEWRPSITVDKDAEGLNLARPFGKSGPGLQCSSSLPDSVLRSMHAVGGRPVGPFGTDTDLFLFLQKRW